MSLRADSEYNNDSVYMDNSIGQLRRAQLNAMTDIESTWSFGDILGSGTSKEQAQKSIAIEADHINLLDGSWRANVLAGRFTLQKWSTYAQEIWDSIRVHYAAIGDFSPGGVVEGTYTETIKEVKEKATNLKDAALPITLVLAVIVIGLIVLRFSL